MYDVRTRYVFSELSQILHLRQLLLVFFKYDIDKLRKKMYTIHISYRELYQNGSKQLDLTVPDAGKRIVRRFRDANVARYKTTGKRNKP